MYVNVHFQCTIINHTRNPYAASLTRIAQPSIITMRDKMTANFPEENSSSLSLPVKGQASSYLEPDSQPQTVHLSSKQKIVRLTMDYQQ